MNFKGHIKLLFIGMLIQKFAFLGSQVVIDEGDKQNEKVRVEDKCSNDVLALFGMKVDEKATKPMKATSYQLEYCRNSRKTCCTTAEIESMVPDYLKSYNGLIKLLEPIEEMLTLFVGAKFNEEIIETIIKEMKAQKKMDTCGKYSKETHSDTDVLNFDLLNDEERDRWLEEATGLLAELESYVKNQHYFYGNLICTICNPSDSEYINLNENGLTITAHTSTCSQLLGMRDYEIRLARFYQSFLRPIGNSHNCLQNGLSKEGNLEKEFASLNDPDLKDWISKIEKCFEEFKIENADCVDQCRKTIGTYKMPFELINVYAQALSYFFEPLTEMEIVSFYEVRKLEVFQKKFPESVDFFKLQKTSENGGNIKLEFGNLGINIFNNAWSKKFTHYRSDALSF